MLWTTSRSLLVAALFPGLLVPSAFPQDSFYKGKTVRFIVGAPSGGGFDTIRALLPGTSRSIFPEIPRCWSTICRARPVWLRPTTCIKRRGLMASRLAPLLAACFYNRCSDGMSWSMPVQWKKKQTGSPKLTNRYQPTSIRESVNRKRLFGETE
jgi:hypothetical protein